MHTSIKITGAYLALAICLCTNQAGAQNKTTTSVNPVADQLQPLLPGAVHLQGHVGKKIDQCIHNRIMVQPVDNLVALFQTKNLDPGGYRGEFIGKWATAAALACRYQPNPELEKKMNKAMADLINSRTAEGYISTYKKEAELKVWDVWIQKYVLLGLIAQYDETANNNYLLAAKASADHLLSLTGPGKLSVEEYGPSFHKGGVNFSILEPVVLLYERTKEKKYLDYASYIVDAWSKPGKYSKNGVRLIENAAAGKPLVNYEVMHTYTLMSDFEGLCELYRVTRKKQYLDACIRVAHAIKKYELMIIGSMSNHEMWYNGAKHQTGILERPNETCATATWMKLCYQLLRLTGDPAWADEMETSLYNGLLGAMMPKGEWWSYDSHLYGERVPSRVQGDHLSCCVSSGPRALLLTPQWASMMGARGSLVVNLFTAGNATYTLPNGETVTITQETDYPRTSLVTLHVQPRKQTTFPLQLRIPAWSSQTVLKVNGKTIPTTPGTYATIERSWKPGDVVTLELDLRGRIVPAPGGETHQAIVRGPIVLAMDNRLAHEQDSAIWLIASPHVYEDFPGNTPTKDFILPTYNFPAPGVPAYIDLKPVTPTDTSIWMAFEVPFVVRPSFQVHREKPVVMCDFSSAGNQWSDNNLYRVWLPQPLLMSNMYARNTWKFAVYNAKVRPAVPAYIQAAVK
jgi:DUF1680 family protein